MKLAKNFIGLLLTTYLTGCATADQKWNDARRMAAPISCDQIIDIYVAAKDDFNSIAAGPEMTGDYRNYRNSSLILPGANYCRIYTSEQEYRCTWRFGSDHDMGGAFYNSLSRQIAGCINEGEVYHKDIKGYTSITTPEVAGYRYVFHVYAHYPTPSNPRGGNFDVDLKVSKR